MRLPWFRRYGLFFVPSNLPGWFIAVLSWIYAVYTFIDIDRHSHSVSDTLINFVFKLLLIALGYSVIGYLASRDQ